MARNVEPEMPCSRLSRNRPKAMLTTIAASTGPPTSKRRRTNGALSPPAISDSRGKADGRPISLPA